jgi:hypothetical protein
MQNLRYYFPGSILIFIAVLIVAVPEILIVFVAASMTVLGIGALYTGHLIRKSEKGWHVFDGRFFGDEPFGWHDSRSPLFRRWW